MKIAMWSGPRNLSTAMMYSFGARADCAVADEPFYAAYLRATGIDHPMREEVLADQENDPVKVGAMLAGPNPDCAAHWYQKHMTFHMVDGFPWDWADDCVHVHLLRHPARVIASYAAKRSEFTLDDIGFEKQVEIFDRFPGPVIDSFDVRQDSETALQRLCADIGLPWDPAMLSWSAGGRPEDGIWAAHWYGGVHRSTGFAGPEGPLPEVAAGYQPVYAQAMKYYEAMRTTQSRT